MGLENLLPFKINAQISDIANQIENHHSVFYGDSDPTAEQESIMQEGDMWVKLSPFSPNQLDGLVFWLDASQITGVEDGGDVEVWEDATDNGHDATYLYNAPILGAAQLNGKNVVQFNTNADVTTILSIPDSDDFKNLSERTVIVVAKDRSGSIDLMSVVRKKTGTSTSSGTLTYFTFGFQAKKPFSVFALGSSTENQANITPVTVWKTYTLDNKNNTEDRIFVDNALALTIPHEITLPDTVHPWFIGGTDSDTGSRKAFVDIAEIMFINRRLTDGERGLLVTYFNSKYGI